MYYLQIVYLSQGALHWVTIMDLKVDNFNIVIQNGCCYINLNMWNIKHIIIFYIFTIFMLNIIYLLKYPKKVLLTIIFEALVQRNEV